MLGFELKFNSFEKKKRMQTCKLAHILLLCEKMTQVKCLGNYIKKCINCKVTF